MNVRVLVLALPFLPVTAAGQRIRITPSAGLYVPLHDQSRRTSLDCPSRPEDLCTDYASVTELTKAASLGLTLAMEWDRRIGIEASIVTAATRQRSQATLTPRRGEVVLEGLELDAVTRAARTTVAALRLTFAHTLGPRTDIAFGAGISLTTIAGEVRDQMMGPSLAIRLRHHLTRHSRLELGIANAFYSLRSAESSVRQHDVVMSAGIGLGLGR